jgi:azurin
MIRMIRLIAISAALAGVGAAEAATQSAADGARDTVEVTIRAVPGMRFDVVRFQVDPGTPIRLVFRNDDEQADMDHNVVITRPGARDEVVQAGLRATAAEHWVPNIPEVLHFTPQIKKDEQYVLRFTAPEEPGAYPYVCTFPGHGFVMFGAMYVGEDIPPIAEDENVPPGQRTEEATAESTRIQGLSYGTTWPAISRTFLPESGPASIAVGITPGGESYNFDAGESYLRYAWRGGFVDNTPHWRGNGNAYAEVLGEIYYRSEIGFPLRIGDGEIPTVRFRGYRLVDSGLPEFRYVVDGVEVRERIEARSNGPGLVRTFEIATQHSVRFLADREAGVRYESSAGRWEGDALVLTPAQARRFTLTMIPERLASQ